MSLVEGLPPEFWTVTEGTVQEDSTDTIRDGWAWKRTGVARSRTSAASEDR